MRMCAFVCILLLMNRGSHKFVDSLKIERMGVFKCNLRIQIQSEAHFTFGGTVNKDTCRIWEKENLIPKLMRS